MSKTCNNCFYYNGAHTHVYGIGWVGLCKSNDSKPENPIYEGGFLMTREYDSCTSFLDNDQLISAPEMVHEYIKEHQNTWASEIAKNLNLDLDVTFHALSTLRARRKIKQVE
jgi:hypothetical protein